MKLPCRTPLRRASTAAVAAIAVAAAFLAAPLHAEAQPSDKWRDYRLIAFAELVLGAQNNLPGNYAVLNPGCTLEVQNNAVQLSASPAPYVVADSITMGAFSSVVDAYFDTELDLAPSAQVTTQHPGQPFPLVLSDLPATPPQVFDPCTLSEPKTVVPTNGNAAFTPGCYGILEVRQEANVTFAGGVYYFLRWDIRDQVSITFSGPAIV